MNAKTKNFKFINDLTAKSKILFFYKINTSNLAIPTKFPKLSAQPMNVPKSFHAPIDPKSKKLLSRQLIAIVLSVPKQYV
jgi:hypothetical protein